MGLSRKRIAEECHKLAVLAQLMQDSVEIINNDISEERGLTRVCSEMIIICDDIVQNVFDVQGVRTSTYMQDLTIKVDTCIRKNFVAIKGTIKQN